MGLFFRDIVSPQGEKNVVNYKYSGSDASLFYKYILSPIAQWVVDHIIPTWLAPNVITMIGFMCTLTPHIIILCMFPDRLGGDVPRWLCFFAAFGQFVYMVLDNADGKQARKTGSSSPLGLLFDHGCDAMNTFIAGLNLFAIIQLGESVMGVTAYILPMVTFYLATWEEYHIGSMDLPIINGPNEGLVFLIIMFLVSGIWGPQVWVEKVGDLQLNQIVLICFISMSVVTFASNFYNVYKKGHNPFGKALYHLIIIAYATFTLFFVTYAMTVTTDANDNAGRVRLFIYIVGFSFAKLVGHLQVAHVTNEEFHQFKRSSIFIMTMLNTIYIVKLCSNTAILNNDYLLYALLGYSLLAYAQFVINITRQLCRVLNIKVFSMGPRVPADDQYAKLTDATA